MAVGSTSSAVNVPPPSAAANSQEHSRFIERQLDTTRRHVKLVDLFSGLMTLAAALLALLLGAAVIDAWVAPLGFWGRLLLFLGAVVGGLAYFVTRVAPLLIGRVNPAYAAQTIEQGSPSLKNSLINVVFLRDDRPQVREVVYRALEQQAASGLASVPIESVVDRSKLIRIAAILAGVMAIGAAYKILSPKDPFPTVARVAAPWADIDPPSRVTIEDIQPGETSLVEGQPLAVSAIVRGIDADAPVWLCIAQTEGELEALARRMLAQDTGLVQDGEVFQGASRGIAAPMDHSTSRVRRRAEVKQLPSDVREVFYCIVAGDAKSARYQVAIKPVTIVLQRIEYRYPDYTRRRHLVVQRKQEDTTSKEKKQPEIAAWAPNTDYVFLENPGDLRALEGTKVKLHATADQPIGSAFVEFDPGAQKGDRPTSRKKMQVDGAQARVEFTLQLNEHRTGPKFQSYQIRFVTKEGHFNGHPIESAIEVIADLSPEVEILQPKPRKIELPANQSLTIETRALDPDYGLKTLALRFHVAGGQSQNQTLLDDPSGRTGQVSQTFDFRPARWGFVEGNVVRLRAIAEDNRTPTANRAQSREIVITITKAVRSAKKSSPADNAQQPPDGRNNQGAQNNQQQQNKQDKLQADQNNSKSEQSKSEQSKSQDSRDQQGSSEKSDQQNVSQQPSAQDNKDTKDHQETGQSAQSESGQESSEQGKEDQGAAGDQKSQANPTGDQGGQNSQGGENNQSGQSDQAGQSNRNNSENSTGQSAQQSDGNNTGQGQTGGASSSSGGSPTRQTKSGQSGESQSESSQAGTGQKAGGSKGDRTPSQQSRDDNSSGENSSSRAAAAHDGEAIERIMEYQQEQRNGSPASEQNGAAPNSANDSQNDLQGQQSENQASQNQQGHSDRNRTGGHPAGRPSDPKSKADTTDNLTQGRHNQTPAKSQEMSDNPMGDGSTKPPKPQQDQGQERNQGLGSAGQTGAGQSSKSDNSAPAAHKANRDRQKTKKPSQEDDNGASEKAQSASVSNRQSDSEGATSGDRSGGGKEGGGQGAKKPGQDRAGSTSPSDEGAGAAPEAGQGETSQQAGDRQLANGKTGTSSNQQGTGSSHRSRSEGDRSKPGRQKLVPSQEPAHGAPSGPDVGGHGVKSSNDQVDRPPPGETPRGSEANLEYARRATNMVLDQLQHQQDQPDEKLLDKLGWSKSQLQDFLNRWQRMQDAAGQSEAGRRQLNQAIKSLGLRRPADRLRQGVRTQDGHTPLRESGGRSDPPAKFLEGFKAFNRGLNRVEDRR